MSPETISNFSSFLNLTFGAKIFLLALSFLYSIFALVVMRQTQLMTRLLDEASFSPFLKFLAAVHFLAAVIIFLLAILVFVLG